MILDSSPPVAILAGEADADLYIQAISRAPRCRISAGTFIGLNFGDRFAYALAKHTGEPLLFKGNDFKKTDIVSAYDARSTA